MGVRKLVKECQLFYAVRVLEGTEIGDECAGIAGNIDNVVKLCGETEGFFIESCAGRIHKQSVQRVIRKRVLQMS